MKWLDPEIMLPVDGNNNQLKSVKPVNHVVWGQMYELTMRIPANPPTAEVNQEAEFLVIKYTSYSDQ